MSKLISTFKIGLDDETKIVLSELKNKLDAVRGTLGVSSALLGSTKPNGGLLNAMGEAANDASEPELLQLGQWVFEGQDKQWVSAHVDSDGCAYYCSLKKSDLIAKRKHWGTHCGRAGHYIKLIGEDFDTSNWRNSAINRQPVNDVEYLSESVPEIQGIEASEIIVDEMGRDYSHNSNCLHAVVPQITQADMQLIFIKNLSDVLIQRMHSMDRFSEDDYAIGGDKLMPWDILFYESLGYYAVLIDGRQKPEISDLLFFWDTGAATDINWNTKSAAFKELRTITEAELPAFRAALEACYV